MKGRPFSAHKRFGGHVTRQLIGDAVLLGIKDVVSGFAHNLLNLGFLIHQFIILVQLRARNIDLVIVALRSDARSHPGAYLTAKDRRAGDPSLWPKPWRGQKQRFVSRGVSRQMHGQTIRHERQERPEAPINGL